MSDFVKLKVDKSDLLCKNGCGFFGNPEWDWYCSKCWRLHNTKQQNYVFDSSPATHSLGATASPQQQQPSQSQSLPAPLNKERPSPFQSLMRRSPGGSRKLLSPQPGGLVHTFSKFEEKKKRQSSDRKTPNIKQMFKKTTLGRDDVVKSKPKDDRLSQPPEAVQVSKQLAEYLTTRLKKTGITDLSRNIQSFIDKVHKRIEVLPIEEVASMVQNFYQALSRRLETHENFAGLEDEERKMICDLTERYVMICCYKVLFCPFSTPDEEKDLEIQTRIRNLNWVTAGHLDCPFKETDPKVRDLIYAAINDILELDGSKVPEDKLASVVNCSKKIFQVLQSEGKGPASADDFFPSLIYILLKANPPRLISNINFITRFANEQRLGSGEEGYYFTNLCCGLSFIENLTAKSLNLPEEEFNSYMSGEAIPPGAWEASLLMCEGIQTMSQNLKTLSDLQLLQQKIISDADALEQDILAFGESVKADVVSVLERTQYRIVGPKRPVTVDCPDLPGPAELPPPLQPQSIAPGEPTGHSSQEDETSSGEIDLPNPPAASAGAGGEISPRPEHSRDGAVSLPSQEISQLPSPTGAQTDSPLGAFGAAGTSYVGFSAQSFSIPSISCNTAASDLLTGSPLGSPAPPVVPPHASVGSSPYPSPSSFMGSSSNPSPSSFTPSSTSPSTPSSAPLSAVSDGTPEPAVWDKL